MDKEMLAMVIQLAVTQGRVDALNDYMMGKDPYIVNDEEIRAILGLKKVEET